MFKVFITKWLSKILVTLYGGYALKGWEPLIYAIAYHNKYYLNKV